ncbi:MAG TPA: gliding motility-associated C-terminal domain-containing protein [Bacteroidia bacterium]|nr:gliding motility-associated C-terminal domain-containing protein [Bacteroidia bacterium]
MKNKFLFFFFIFFVCGIFSPLNSQNWLWGRAGNSNSSAEGISIAADDAGAVYFGGSYTAASISFGTITLTNPYGNDGFLVKYDSTGNVLWAKNFDGPGAEIVYNVSTDHFGNVFVIGEFSSASMTIDAATLFNASSSGFSYDIFIVKFDGSGNLIYAKREGGIDNDWGYSIAEDGLGNSYFTGMFTSSSITFGATTLTNVNPGMADLFITQYDPLGNPVWAKSAGGNAEDYGISLAADAAGNVFLTGYFSSPTLSFGTSTISNAGGGTYDILLAEYNITGNLIRVQSLGGPYTDFANYISIDASDNIFIAGAFYSQTINFGSVNLANTDITGGSSDAFLVKSDSAGNFQWAKQAGGSNVENGWSVSDDNNGNIYFIGHFYSPSIQIDNNTIYYPANGTDPVFIVKYDEAGNLICYSSLISGGDDEIAVAGDAFGNVFVGGDFVPTPFILGNDTLSSNGFEAPFVAKYRCEEMIVVPPPQTDCEIYIPNAFSPNNDGQNDFECVRGNCIQSIHFAIYDRWGEKVFESSDQNVCWDGTYRGVKLENAVFYYTLDAVLLNGDKIQKSGNISLVK